jgi:hypothetical protein
MTPPHADRLYYDSEAMLRLVDNALDELHPPPAAPTPPASAGAASDAPHAATDALSLSSLPPLLLRAYQEINSVVCTLRRSRDLLEEATVNKLHQTGNKLREVSSATEVAATDMLDGLDRALAIVDELDAGPAAGESDRATTLRDDLRNELFGLMNCLQFQDITTQQLGYASSVLVEVEDRLSELARVFDPHSHGIEGPAAAPPAPAAPAVPAVAFDPAASTGDAEQRQALVDEIFARG